MRLVLLLALLASTAAALYCCLLPLWEGFDEPFHYGYIESLASGRMPVLGRTRISAEVRESLKLAPVSPILHRSLPKSISFPEWFALPVHERLARRAALGLLHAGSADSELANYEAQQAPLAYLVFVPVNALVSFLPLPSRILVLRLCGAFASAVLLYAAAQALAQALGLEHPYRFLAFACMFESQMLWASIAHVSNDWLAIPLATAFLAYLAVVVRASSIRNSVILAVLLAAGLLTKAYILAFAPVFIAVLVLKRVRSIIPVLPLVVAGTYYIRNLFLYGNAIGLQESMRGVTLARTFEAAFHINWISSAIELTRWSLWTGNWSFVAFSRTTLTFEVLLLTASFCILFFRFRQITNSELWVLLALLCFALALAFDTCVAFVDTRGLAQSAEPWYPQAVMPAVWILACLGLQRNGVLGRFVGGLLCGVAAWIALLTYIAKLFPLYGGYNVRATLPAVWKWWTSNPSTLLSSVTLAPPLLLYALLAIFAVCLIVVNAAILKRLVSPSR